MVEYKNERRHMDCDTRATVKDDIDEDHFSDIISTRTVR